jgi:hypothetical protein
MSMSLSPAAVEAYIPLLLQVIDTDINQWLDLRRVQMMQLVSASAWSCRTPEATAGHWLSCTHEIVSLSALSLH